MSGETSNRELLDAWKAGDEDAAGVLFERYQTRLLGLVRVRLSRKLARRVDPEDVLLSAYRSFFTSARGGRVVAAADDDLWPLLKTFVLRKLARQARRNLAERRSIEHEQFNESNWLQTIVGQGPTPEQAAILADEVERLLTRLDATGCEVLVRTLQGDDAETIATALGVNERTVRRALVRIRSELPVEPLALPLTAPTRIVSQSVAQHPARSTAIIAATTRHDRYLLHKFVGAGAFSKVYRAIDRETGEAVAVKFLRKECWDDVRASESLIRECGILQKLRHPNILHLRGWGATPRGALFLATDYVAGGDLSTWRNLARPTIQQIVEVLIRVAEAVAAAHAAGVLHCDLKPANVLRREDGSVVLCDFGLARYATAPDEIPRGGTAGFLCPEQISDDFGPVTERSDVYGLGALLYALLTGRPPSIGRDLPETLANVLSSKPPLAPSASGAESTDTLDVVVLRCLRKDPHERYASAHEVSRTLDEIFQALT